MNKLTPKQQRFVDLIPACKFNIQQASKKAGFTYGYGRQLMTKTNVQEALAKVQEKVTKRVNVTVDRIVQEYARIAFVDPRKFYDDEGELIPVHKLDEDTARTIGGIEHHHGYEFTREGKSQESKDKGVQKDKQSIGSTTKIKMIDKKGGLDSLAKYKGMMVDKHELVGDVPVEIHVNRPRRRKDSNKS